MLLCGCFFGIVAQFLGFVKLVGALRRNRKARRNRRAAGCRRTLFLFENVGASLARPPKFVEFRISRRANYRVFALRRQNLRCKICGRPRVAPTFPLLGHNGRNHVPHYRNICKNPACRNWQAGSLFYTSMITGRIMGFRLVVLYR